MSKVKKTISMIISIALIATVGASASYKVRLNTSGHVKGGEANAIFW